MFRSSHAYTQKLSPYCCEVAVSLYQCVFRYEDRLNGRITGRGRIEWEIKGRDRKLGRRKWKYPPS